MKVTTFLMTLARILRHMCAIDDGLLMLMEGASTMWQAHPTQWRPSPTYPQPTQGPQFY